MARSRQTTPNQLASLAVAMASGVPVRKWARKRNIPERTCYRWSKLPEVLEQVEAIRARLRDEAIGRLTARARTAVSEISKLMTKAESESVRLQACRAILSELVSIGTYVELERDVKELKAKLAAIQERDKVEGTRWASETYGD